MKRPMIEILEREFLRERALVKKLEDSQEINLEPWLRKSAPSGAVIVMNFSGVYDRERFASGPGIVQIDCRHLNGTDCYCDEEGAAEIRRLIAPYPPEGIHFIDNGNHHYVTGFWMEKIREPFSLIVFDHHPDV